MPYDQQEEKPRIPDIIIEKLDRSFKDKKEELRIALCEYQGTKFAGLRVFWLGRDGEMLPGKQGISIRAKEIRKVIAALQTIAEEIAK